MAGSNGMGQSPNRGCYCKLQVGLPESRLARNKSTARKEPTTVATGEASFLKRILRLLVWVDQASSGEAVQDCAVFGFGNNWEE